MNYIAYWIPLTNTIDFTRAFGNLQERTKKVDISDNVVNKKNILKISINENRDITLSLNNEHTYQLTYYNSFNNGLVIYSYNNSFPQNIIEILPLQVYHEFKDFFHTHEAHDIEEDSLLSAYSSKSEPIKNEVILYYCEKYISKFNYYHNNIISYNSPTIIWEHFIKSKTYMIPDAINTISIGQKNIHKIQTELNYFLYLVNNCSDDINKNYFLREYKNNKFKFHILYQEYEILDNKLDTEYTKIINKYQLYLGYLGAGLGVIGIGFAMWGINLAHKGLTTNDFIKVKDNIYIKQIEFETKIHKSINLLKNQNDTLNINTSKIQKEHNELNKVVKNIENNCNNSINIKKEIPNVK